MEPDWLPFFRLPEWEETSNEIPDPYGVFAEGASERRTQDNENKEIAFATSIRDWAIGPYDTTSTSGRIYAVLLCVRAAVILCSKASEIRRAQLGRILEHLLILLYKDVLRRTRIPMELTSEEEYLDRKRNDDDLALRLINNWTFEFPRIPPRGNERLITDLTDLFTLIATDLAPPDAYCILVGAINCSGLPPVYAQVPTHLACRAILRMTSGQANYMVSVLSLLMSLTRRLKPQEPADQQDLSDNPPVMPWPTDGLLLVQAFCDGIGSHLRETPKDDVHGVSRNSIFSAIGRVLYYISDFVLVDETTLTLKFSSNPKMNNTQLLKPIRNLLASLVRVSPYSSIIELAAAVNILSPTNTETISDMELNALALARVFAMCLLDLHYGGTPFPVPQPICYALSRSSILSAMWKPVTCLASHALTTQEGHNASKYLTMQIAELMWHYVPAEGDSVFATEHGLHIPLPECLAKFVEVLALWSRDCGEEDRLRRANLEGLRRFMSRFDPKPAASILTQVLHTILTEGEEVLRPTAAAFLLKLIRNVRGYDQMSVVETARKEVLDLLKEDAILTTWGRVIHELANLISVSPVLKTRSRSAMEDLRSRIETVLSVDNDKDLMLAAAAVDLAIAQ